MGLTESHKLSLVPLNPLPLRGGEGRVRGCDVRTHRTFLSQSSIAVIPLLFLFTFFPSFSQIAVAAPSSAEAQQVQNPNVTFEKGLLSAQAEGVKLKALMEGISKKADIGVSINPALQEKKVAVQFGALMIGAWLKAFGDSTNHRLGEQSKENHFWTFMKSEKSRKSKKT